MNADDLRRAYQQFHQEGMRLGGEVDDVARRAAIFRHIYRHSGQNHVFPLIAAHATLWVRDYSLLGARLAWWLSWPYGVWPRWRRQRLAAMEKFIAALREINRRICAATYADYYLTDRFGDHPAAAEVVDAALLAPLRQIHAARRAGRKLSDQQKLEIFWPHFVHEQEFHVGPGMAAALADLDWPLVRFLALRPVVRFAYFPPGLWLWLGNSLSQRRRVASGLRTFQAAVKAGWQRTEESLAEYGPVLNELNFEWASAQAAPSGASLEAR
ncbi:MAG TPA: hypothetical protein VFB96_01150 [Pirellulaceae bacterium]|nr:hypothetical protein [Pirellulaceae bacterium]